jgi:dTDP-glucose pyrophosphorylase
VFERDKFLIAPERTIAEAVALIDRNSAGIVLVATGDGRFLGTVTDGDVRRAMLRRERLDAPVATLLTRPAGTPHQSPVTAPAGTSADALLDMMQQHGIRQIPLLDADGRVADLALLEQLTLGETRAVRAVVMAGGFGKRLAPLTAETPKPMLPVGDRPLMERLVRDIRNAGIRKVHITTHFRPEKIHDHFGRGDALDVELGYVTEEQPLGTAGALRLVEPSTEPLLVINGDILTKVNFQALIRFHEESDAALTVGVRSYEIAVPYGVVETEHSLVTRIVEKPTYRHFVNAGIYVVEPRAVQHIPSGRRFDMTDLIAALLATGDRVASFPVREYWLDIGRPEDYEQAQRDHATGALD